MSEIKTPQMISITEAAKMFNLPVFFLRTKVANKEIFAVKSGKKYLINAELLSNYLYGKSCDEEKRPTEEKK